MEHFHTYFLVPTCNIPTLGRELRGGILLGHRVSKCLPSMDIARLSEVGVGGFSPPEAEYGPCTCSTLDLG